MFSFFKKKNKKEQDTSKSSKGSKNKKDLRIEDNSSNSLIQSKLNSPTNILIRPGILEQSLVNDMPSPGDLSAKKRLEIISVQFAAGDDNIQQDLSSMNQITPKNKAEKMTINLNQEAPDKTDELLAPEENTNSPSNKIPTLDKQLEKRDTIGIGVSINNVDEGPTEIQNPVWAKLDDRKTMADTKANSAPFQGLKVHFNIPEEKDVKSLDALDGNGPNNAGSRKSVLQLEVMNAPVKRPSKFKAYFKKLKYVFVLLLYIFPLPLVIVMLANNYSDKNVKIVINYGSLGVFLGLVQLALMREMIDLMILKKIYQEVGKNKKLVKADDYIIVKKKTSAAILIASFCIQLICGFIQNATNIPTNLPSIIVSSFINVLINTIFWLVIVFIKTFYEKQDTTEKKVRKEFKRIDNYRDNFKEDLKHVREDINQIEETKQKMYTNFHRAETRLEILRSNLKAKIDEENKFDLREFVNRTYNLKEEASKFKNKSLKAYINITGFLVQILTNIYLIKSIIYDVADGVEIVLAFVIALVGFSLGNFLQAKKFIDPILSEEKAVSLITNAAIFRFILMNLSTREQLYRLVILKYVFKIVVYILGVHATYFISSKLKRNVPEDLSIVEYFEPKKLEEYYHLKFARFWYQKYVLSCASDLYFIIATMVGITASRSWLPDGGFNSELGLMNPDLDYYQLVSGLEIIVEILAFLLMNFSIRRMMKKYDSSKEFDLNKDLKANLLTKKYVITSFQNFTLFILFFIFFNQL